MDFCKIPEKNEKNNLIHQPKGVGCLKALFKTDENIVNSFRNIEKKMSYDASP